MLNVFLKFNFSSIENSCREDFLYNIIFCVEFDINKERLDLYKGLSINLNFLYSSCVELEALVKCWKCYPILMKSWSPK